MRVALALLLLAIPSYAQSTWYVDVTASPPGNGTPQSPYAGLQHAIAQPSTLSGDRIVVAPGTYREALDFLGKRLVVRSSGGAGVTVLDGSGLGARIVRIASGEGAGTRLQGFTVRNAQSVVIDGGAVLCQNSTVEIRDCTFLDNALAPWEADRGGAVAAVNATVDIVRCTFANCRAITHGGGVYARYAKVRIDHCSFTSCVAVYEGGGAVAGAIGSVLDIVRSVFHSNECSTDAGGAVYLENGGIAGIRDCEFESNHVAEDRSGGAIAFVGPSSTGVIERCRFADNVARRGGAIFSSNPFTVRDSIFVLNRVASTVAVAEGGAISGPGTVERSIFWRNSLFAAAGANGGGAVIGCVLLHCTLVENSIQGTTNGSAAASSTLRDCIVWGNQPAAFSLHASSAMWSDVDVPAPGTGNIGADPHFASAPVGDLRLLPGSPCIDAGDPAGAPDPDGSRADMGAAPFYPDYGAPPARECAGKISSLGCLPYIGHNGAPPSVSGGLFAVLGHGLRGDANGLLVWSPHPASIPFQNGLLCVGAPSRRTPLQWTGPNGNDCTGQLAFQWSAAYLDANDLDPGATVHCQFWSRDLGDPYGSSLTDALSFQLVP
jgi:hypothetical protein